MKKTLGLVALLLSGVLCASYAAEPAHWLVFTDKSSITWTASYGENPVTGTLPIDSADVVFDPDALAASKAVIKIGIAKERSKDSDAQQNLMSPEWFSAAQYPQATFESTAFTKTGDHYTMQGNLTLRGKTLPVSVPFTLTTAADNTAHVEAQAVIKRLDFGVGQGDWAKTDVVANEVQINIILEAKHVP